MKIYIISVLVCILPLSLCWEYPGYPGVYCPTAREKMLADKDTQWIIPKCHEDGTFVDLQCYENYQNVCMCVAPDGSPLTLPGFGVDAVSCVCWMAQYNIFVRDPDAEMPACANDGYFRPLQCSEATGECWCVDKYGEVTVPPSKDVHSCS